MFKKLNKTSLLTRVGFILFLTLILFSLLNLYTIYNMHRIFRITEGIYNHPFTVSNAILRIELSMEKIKSMINYMVLSGQNRDKNLILIKQITELDSKIGEDFNIIGKRFLGDMQRFKKTEDSFNQWRDYRKKTLADYKNGKTRNLNSIYHNSQNIERLFASEIEYLRKFAQNRAIKFLQDSASTKERTIRTYLALLFFLILTFTLIINLLLKNIKDPLTELMDAVGDISHGNFDRRIHLNSGGREFIQLSDTISDMASKLQTLYGNMERKVEERTAELQDALTERETLIRELYHRTKNNMQVIKSIISLQKFRFEEKKTRDLLQDLENKIQSMALVHQMLYSTGDLSHIFLNDYFKELMKLLIKTFNTEQGKATIETEMDEFPVLLDLAIPCGLVLNELITNSLKYAFPDDRKGTISLQLKKTDDIIEFVYRDDGIGLNENFDINNLDSLGLIMIKTITEHQLNGEIEITGNSGFYCRLQFQDDSYRNRL